jgi:hypothetical protein
MPDNGQVERMNRTIKEATVKRYHYDSHDQLRTHLADFMATYNFARRLKTINGLTPYEDICKIWTSEPDRFILDPIHQRPGLNILVTRGYSGGGAEAETGRGFHSQTCLRIMQKTYSVDRQGQRGTKWKHLNSHSSLPSDNKAKVSVGHHPSVLSSSDNVSARRSQIASSS